jgi:hypothetical protein
MRVAVQLNFFFLDSLLFSAEHSHLSSSTLLFAYITTALLRFFRLLSLLLFALSFTISCIIYVCLRRNSESIEMYLTRRQTINFKVYLIYSIIQLYYYYQSGICNQGKERF